MATRAFDFRGKNIVISTLLIRDCSFSNDEVVNDRSKVIFNILFPPSRKKNELFGRLMKLPQFYLRITVEMMLESQIDHPLAAELMLSE